MAARHPGLRGRRAVIATQRLLAEARQASWALWIDGGTLHYRAPLGYDPHLLERLRKAKVELLRVLGEPRPPSLSRMSVYRYRLTDKPGTWLVLIAPGCDLDEARRVLENQFGAERLIEVVENR